MRSLSLDYKFQFGHSPKIRNIVSAFVFFPGFRAVAILRLQIFAQERSLYRLALLLSNLNHANTGAEICVGAQIGVPILIRHPTGIVVGGGAVIGSRCTILQGVTIGEKYVESPDGIYPVIEDGVKIGCNSSVLGNVRVGANAIIGAHTLVLKNVDPGTTVMGTH